jgi:hypothetical protein
MVSCGTVTYPTGTPTVIGTPFVMPTRPSIPYFHYTPLEENNVHLEFDYPSYWYLKEGKNPYYEQYTIFLSDPLILTMPTRDPNQSHGNPGSYGRIYIWIQPLPSNQTIEGLVSEHKESMLDNTNSMTLLHDYPIKINGYDAYIFESLIDIPEAYSSVMFSRIIFFILEGQLYRIDLFVSVNERGGEFEKGYEYFFNSLKIVP